MVFSTGTDEHGLKIQQAAALAGESPHLHCSRVSDLFRVAFDQCEVRHSDFIRTTDDKHKENVQQFWVIDMSQQNMLQSLKLPDCNRKS